MRGGLAAGLQEWEYTDRECWGMLCTAPQGRVLKRSTQRMRATSCVQVSKDDAKRLGPPWNRRLVTPMPMLPYLLSHICVFMLTNI